MRSMFINTNLISMVNSVGCVATYPMACMVTLESSTFYPFGLLLG